MATNNAQNAVIINGVTYELVPTDDRDECKECALLEPCNACNDKPCVIFFDDADGMHFERK